jgi:hypothetical protein
MLSLLGRLYAEAGRLPEAVRIARQALVVATGRNDRELVRELKEMIASYESHPVTPKR